MTTYYISPSGHDTNNNGLGPDASHGTNRPWLTLAKALTTGSPVSPGDTIYVAPGYYYSAGNITPISAISSVGSPTQIIGDPLNAQGFKDSGGVRLAPGIPWLTTRTSGEGLDGGIASTNSFFNNQTNKCSGLQFRKLFFEVASSQASAIWRFDPSGGTDTLFDSCVLSGRTGAIYVSGAPTAGLNLTLRNSVFLVRDALSFAATTAAATADANLNIVIENNLIIGTINANAAAAIGAAGGNIGGGIQITGNTIIAALSAAVTTTASRVSTVNPIRLKGNLFVTTGGILSAGATGEIIDDGYNRSINGTPYTNVSLGTGSVLHVAPNVVLPHLTQWGLEMPRFDFFGWTDAAHADQKFSASGIVTADFRGRTIRPWGAGASIGCWQVPDVVQDTSSAITGGGANSLKLTGAGEVSLYIPVDATGFTVSIKTKSTSYGGTNYPQIVVVANPAIGVASDTTATASDASEQTITTATITPTAKGVLEVRLISRSSSASSVTYFDLLASA